MAEYQKLDGDGLVAQQTTVDRDSYLLLRRIVVPAKGTGAEALNSAASSKCCGSIPASHAQV
jgi:hypothetical protein